MIGKINVSNGSSGLKIYQQESEPHKKSGLWVKNDKKIKKIKFLNYQPDTYTSLPTPILQKGNKERIFSITDDGIMADKDKIYIVASTYDEVICLIAYDIKNEQYEQIIEDNNLFYIDVNKIVLIDKNVFYYRAYGYGFYKIDINAKTSTTTRSSIKDARI